MHTSDGTPHEALFALDAINRNASFNHFSHDFSTAVNGNLNSVVDKVSKPTPSDTLSYLQYLDGVYTKIVIPGLETIKNDPAYKNIAVNKARITIPIYFDNNIFKPSTVPSQLYLRYKTKTGVKDLVPDYYINQAFLGGAIDSTANVYTFNIPAFVQDYLDDKTNTLVPELEIFQYAGIKNLIIEGQ